MTLFSLQQVSSMSEDFLLQVYPRCLRPLCRHPARVAILFVCLDALVIGIATLIFGGFSAGAKVNVLQDWGLLPAWLFAFGIFYYYFKMPSHFGRMLDSLRDNGVFAADEIGFGERIRKIARTRCLSNIPILVAVGFCLLQIPMYQYSRSDFTYWYDIHPINSIVSMVFWMLVWLILSGFLISMGIAGAALNSIFANNKIVVHSLHPDKSGGFSPVANFAFHLTLLALIVGIDIGVIAFQAIQRDTFRSLAPVLMLAAIAYLIVVPTLFYLPIRGAHKAMTNFRHDLIRETYKRYSCENQSKYNLENNDRLTNIEGAVGQMDILKRLATHESSYPTWPFGHWIRAGVFLNSIFPLACTLTGVIFDNILNH